MESPNASLVSITVERIADLEGDEAKEESLRTLGSILAGSDIEAEEAEKAFRVLLRLSTALRIPWGRARAFADACDSIACSRLPRDQRIALLEHALELGEACDAPVERIDRSRAALEALLEIHRDEDVAERLSELAKSAAELADGKVRARALASVAIALARAGECKRAIAELDQLAPSAVRGRSLALVAAELFAAGEVEEASMLMQSTIGEIRAEPESFDQAQALRTVLSTLFETGIEFPTEDALAMALDGVDQLKEARFRKEALLGAIEGLVAEIPGPDRFGEMLERLTLSVERVDETFTRAPLLGELAVALASRGDFESALGILCRVVDLARSAPGEDLGKLLGDPASALPIPRILSELADEENPAILHASAIRLLDLVASVDEPATVAGILRQCAQLFASPALPYEARIALLDRALFVAQGIRALDQCVETVTAIANALSLAGATERGDGLFAGLVIGIDPRVARRAYLDRAISLNRLGRTAEAQGHLAAAAALSGEGTGNAVEELAEACARCGFMGHLIDALARVDAVRQVDARTQIADVLAELHYLDPDLRIIGLEAVAKDAPAHLEERIAAIVAEVRLLERLGDPEEVVRAAFERTKGLDRKAAGLFEQQIVRALLERLRRGAPRG